MEFHKHPDWRKGTHAFLGASKYHWINYDEEKLISAWFKAQAAERGTRLHAFAAECIELKQRLPKSKLTLNMFVNDAIGFRMTPEQILYFSDNCFGTCDAIAFDERKKKLLIFDLKTGESQAHIEQLLVYAALFCLEYGFEPSEIDIELRIYQNDDVLIESPEASDIDYIIDKIKTFDNTINNIKWGN